VIASEAASNYCVVRDLTVSSTEFSTANGSCFSMKSFATLEVVFWAWDQHDICEKLTKMYIHGLIADNVVNNSHTELGFDTFSWLEASGFKLLP